jgi:hypothetical protein
VRPLSATPPVAMPETGMYLLRTFRRWCQELRHWIQHLRYKRISLARLHLTILEDTTRFNNYVSNTDVLYFILVMKLLVMQFSPTSCHFIPFRCEYSPMHPVVLSCLFNDAVSIEIGWWMKAEQLVESELPGEIGVHGENWLQCQITNTNPTQADLATKPGRRGGKTATSLLSRTAASYQELYWVQGKAVPRLI